MGGSRSARGLRRRAPAWGVPVGWLGEAFGWSSLAGRRTDDGVAAGVGWVVRWGTWGLTVSGEGAGAETAKEGRAEVAAWASESSASANPTSADASRVGALFFCRLVAGDALDGVLWGWVRRVVVGAGRDGGDWEDVMGLSGYRGRGCIPWNVRVGGRAPWLQRLGGAAWRAGGRGTSSAGRAAPHRPGGTRPPSTPPVVAVVEVEVEWRASHRVPLRAVLEKGAVEGLGLVQRPQASARLVLRTMVVLHKVLCWRDKAAERR